MDNWRLTQLLDLHKSDPTDEFILFAIAQEYQKAGMLKKSLEYYTTLKNINPNYVGMYYHLGALLIDMDRPEDGLHCYEEGIGVARKLNDHHALSELLNAKTNLELEI